MRVAALYDIHSNLPALEAVIADVRAAGVDRIIIGGDVLPGPLPVETLRYLGSLDMPLEFLHGNGDREVLAAARGNETASLPAPVRDALRWTAQQLSAKHCEQIARWPPTVRLTLPPLGEILFCHATPRNDTDIFTRLTPEEPLLSLFSGLNADIVVCGHTHMPFDRTIGSTRVLNPGSVGMPFCQPAGAYWLLFEPAPSFRRTQYDLEKAAARIRSSNYPQAAEFAENNILHPTSEADMLHRLAEAELR